MFDSLQMTTPRNQNEKSENESKSASQTIKKSISGHQNSIEPVKEVWSPNFWTLQGSKAISEYLGDLMHGQLFEHTNRIMRTILMVACLASISWPILANKMILLLLAAIKSIVSSNFIQGNATLAGRIPRFAEQQCIDIRCPADVSTRITAIDSLSLSNRVMISAIKFGNFSIDWSSKLFALTTKSTLLQIQRAPNFRFCQYTSASNHDHSLKFSDWTVHHELSLSANTSR